MTGEPSHHSLLESLLRTILTSGGVDALRGAAQGLRALGERVAGTRPQGIYEVLEHHTTLELLDPQGEDAVVARRQEVRFLQDYVAALTDYAWGDGEIFAEYTCSPGHPVDFYPDGSRHAVLISLRETKNRGDTLTLETRRRIRGGFGQEEEVWETEVYHRTRQLSVEIVFPTERPCQGAVVIQRDTSTTTALGPEHVRRLADGRQQVEWRLRKPRLHGRYALKWRW